MSPDPVLAAALALALADEPRAAAVVLDPVSWDVVAEYRTGGADPAVPVRVGSALTPLLLAVALDSGAVTLDTPLDRPPAPGETVWSVARPPQTLAEAIRDGCCTGLPKLVFGAELAVRELARGLPFSAPDDPIPFAFGDFVASPLDLGVAYAQLVRACDAEGIVGRQVARDVLAWLVRTDDLPSWVGAELAVGVAPDRVVVLWVDAPRRELVRTWRELIAAIGAARPAPVGP